MGPAARSGTLLPYTTLFRSGRGQRHLGAVREEERGEEGPGRRVERGGGGAGRGVLLPLEIHRLARRPVEPVEPGGSARGQRARGRRAGAGRRRQRVGGRGVVQGE